MDHDWKQIETNNDLETAIEDEIAKIKTTKDDPKTRKATLDKIDDLLHLKLTYEMTQRRIYLLRKAQERGTQIFDRSMMTQIFILVIAAIAIGMAIVLFGLMIVQAGVASGLYGNQGEDKLTAAVMASIFGGFGVADIFILMKYIMNRSQRSLSDMVQTLITYISYREQADALIEWRQLKMENKDPNITIKELIKLNKNLRLASSAAVRNIQKHVDEDNIELEPDESADPVDPADDPTDPVEPTEKPTTPSAGEKPKDPKK